MSVTPATSRPSRTFRPRRRLLTGALVIVAALVGFACGDDDDEEAATPTTAKVDYTAYCDAAFQLESYFAEDPDIDFETASPDEVSAAIRTYIEGAKPLVDALVPLVPAEIKKPTDVLIAGFNEALTGANPEEVFERPEVKAAEDEAHAFDLRSCGWGNIDASAQEYSFTGIPAEIKAGRTSIDLTNKGKELHEIVLLTKNPGVTESFDEIFALGEEGARSKVHPVASGFASPGEDDYSVVELAKGDYVAACFIPQGLTSQDSEPSPDAKAHVELGMKTEFKVT